MFGKKIKSLFEKHREHFLTIAFVCGFIVDNLTLTRVDQLFDNAILLTYIVLAMGSLLVIYAASAGKFSEELNERLKRFAPLLTQYAFGGLFSGMLIFYGRSGSWLVSWPFLLIILAVIFANETIHDRVQRLLYNIGMLFVGLFAYVVLIVPVVVGKMGALVFLGSGVLALFIMFVFVRTLGLIVPRFISLHQRAIVFIIGIIYATFNFLYFANIIPPIPLSLKEVGVFHSVVRYPEDNTYELKYEKGEWWQFYKRSDDIFHPSAGGNAFCFAKVFAPTTIQTDIYHRWEYYDEAERKWIDHFRMSYPIVGGGGDGYRGYTSIQSGREGTWRCTVETERGQVLGRGVFKISSEGGGEEFITREE
jgi:MFS family permease